MRRAIRSLIFALLTAFTTACGGAAEEPVGDPFAALEAMRLNLEAVALATQGRLVEAAEAMERVVSLQEKAYGPEHRITALNRATLAQLLYELGKPGEAREQLERAIPVLVREFGPEAPQVTSALTTLAAALQDLGELRTARTVAEKALELTLSVHGAEHLATAAVLNRLGLLLTDLGELGEARKHLTRALEIRRETLDPQDTDLAISLTNLARLDLAEGNHDLAEERLREALVIAREAEAGRPGLLTAAVAEGLAVVLQTQHELAEARSLLAEVLAIRREHHGDQHPEVARALGNLGVVLVMVGERSQGLDLLDQAVLISLDELGVGHPQTLDLVESLLSALAEGGATEETESMLREILDLRETIGGGDPSNAVLLLSNLGAAAGMGGDLENARIYLERALALAETTLGPRHPYRASVLLNLGAMDRARGDFEEAQKHFEQALEIWRERLGPDHPETSLAALALGAVLEVRGDFEGALRKLEEAAEGQEKALLQTLTLGSEGAKIDHLGRWRETGLTHLVVAFQARSAPDDPRALHLAMETVLRRKGRPLDAAVAGVDVAREGGLSEELQELARLRQEKANLAFRSAPEEPGDERSTTANLNRKIREAEERLFARTAALGALRPVHLEDIQAQIPEGAALVELFVYQAPDLVSFTAAPPRYIAYVLHRTGPPRFADLGDAARIDAAARSFREALDRRWPTAREVGRELDGLTLAKVRPLLAEGVRTLWLSPDSELSLIPFAALVDEERRYLVETFTFLYLSSGRDLLPRPHGNREGEEPFVVGDVDFGDPGACRDRTGPFGGIPIPCFSRLWGTGEEARAVASQLGVPPSEVLTGDRATEEALKQVHGPRLLHLATHGFFLPPPTGADHRGPEGLGDPLLYSGIALAGANRPPREGGGEDGILTALEVASLDLSGTRLAVLSACQSGLGEVPAGEGVFGLRRALSLAGAETQVMSLWRVSDSSTRELMISWYRQLLAGVPIAEALRRIQLAALSGEPLPASGRPLRGSEPAGSDPTADPLPTDSRHPYFWAPFIVSGRGGTIELGAAPAPPR